ncbi:MAG: hypothetical protein QME16_07520, partial [Planctomycetota bacterium]|nr:hypothetical protein [Planctomycetota bacterium]
DMIEATRLVGVNRIFSINLIINSKDEVIKIFCGDIIKAHRKSCDYLDKTYRVRVKSKADLIIVSAGGYPTDVNFIQTHKSIENASYTLKDRGKMVVVAECKDGIGSDVFLKWFDYKSPQEMESALRKEFTVYGNTAMCSLIKARRFDIYLYSTLESHFSGIVRKIALIPVKNLQGDLQRIIKGLPENPVVYIIPKGYSLLPTVSPASSRSARRAKTETSSTKDYSGVQREGLLFPVAYSQVVWNA